MHLNHYKTNSLNFHLAFVNFHVEFCFQIPAKYQTRGLVEQLLHVMGTIFSFQTDENLNISDLLLEKVWYNVTQTNKVYTPVGYSRLLWMNSFEFVSKYESAVTTFFLLYFV